MSQENVDVVRESLERFNRGDVADESFIRRCYDSQVEIFEEPTMPDGRVWSGHDGIGDYLAEVGERWAEFRVEETEILDIGEAVVVVGAQQGRARRSGVDLSEWPFAAVYDFSDGRIARIRLYHERAAALEAAQLSE